MYGKDCPHHELFDHSKFEADVKRVLEGDTSAKKAAQKVIDVISALYMASADKDVQGVAHFAADAIRDKYRIPKP